jgi:hypothetical protein
MTVRVRGIAQIVVLERLLVAGCEPWRGPIEIEDGRRICQVRDPSGTVWGLDGP